MKTNCLKEALVQKHKDGQKFQMQMSHLEMKNWYWEILIWIASKVPGQNLQNFKIRHYNGTSCWNGEIQSKVLIKNLPAL